MFPLKNLAHKGLTYWIDALATLVVSASVDMVLTPKASIFHLQHQKS